MASPQFQPGFRLSALDIVVLIGGTILSFVLWQQTWWMGFVVAFVVGHFFLFCNVVRMARPLELAWSAVFVLLAGATVLTDTPGWSITTAVSAITTVIVVAIEMRKPSYHGIGWKRINAGLPEWWETRYPNNVAKG
jgi:hypothetical protein